MLLALPLALTRPRLTRAWLIPLVLWTAPALEARGSLRLLLTGIAVAVAVSVVGIRPIRAGRSTVASAVVSGAEGLPLQAWTTVNPMGGIAPPIGGVSPEPLTPTCE
jgi:hypothetical protein